MITQLPFQTWFPYAKVKPQASLRLFCFPYAGGGASLYRRWGEKFPASIEVLPVQLPGRENRVNEAAWTSIQETVAQLGSALLPYLDKPFVFFGHSMGALISFELARYLRRKRLPAPRHLFLSASRAAHLPNRWPLLHNLPDEQLVENLLRLGGTARELLENTETLAVILPLMRADFAVCETYTYTPEPPLDVSISIFGGKEDQTVNWQELDAWQKHTCGVFLHHMFPGNHFFLHNQEDLLLSMTIQIARWVMQQL
jgi:surfactin synthase thioesterase subunit